MTSTPTSGLAPGDLQAAVAERYLTLAAVLEDLVEEGWDTPSLCARWRVREVVAHVTMPARYSPEAFFAELAACGGDFAVLSDTIAARDATLATDVLVANLRDEVLHRWIAPGGGPIGALSHVVIHGLDVTVPLGVTRRAPDHVLLALLETLTAGASPNHFGVAVDRLGLRATDLDWRFGSAPSVAAPAEDLVLLLSGRAPR